MQVAVLGYLWWLQVYRACERNSKSNIAPREAAELATLRLVVVPFFMVATLHSGLFFAFFIC